MTDTRAFQPLSARLAGRVRDTTLHDGVPPWLEHPLREWLDENTDGDLARRVVIHLRLAVIPPLHSDYADRIAACDATELLDAVDAAIQLHRVWKIPSGEKDPAARRHAISVMMAFREVDSLLTEAGSMYRVDFTGRCLVRRVDATMEDAADASLTAAPPTAADHLRAAWTAAYGLTPDPDKVFNEAIRAVEELACPLVEGKKAAKNVATLGTVIGELKNSGHVWALVLPAKGGNPRDVASVVSMMETLWEAQVSRHGGAPKARRQTQEEAEAAVHLAVLLVQWLNSGVLRKK